LALTTNGSPDDFVNQLLESIAARRRHLDRLIEHHAFLLAERDKLDAFETHLRKGTVTPSPAAHPQIAEPQKRRPPLLDALKAILKARPGLSIHITELWQLAQNEGYARTTADPISTVRWKLYKLRREGFPIQSMLDGMWMYRV
jgi:hypothetical protein